MNVHFYIDNEEETPIMDMYDVPIEPFKVGDRIHLSVEEIYPKEMEGYKDSLRKKMLEYNKELEELFNHNIIQIKRMGKYARFNQLNEAKITIEYHCILLINNG